MVGMKYKIVVVVFLLLIIAEATVLFKKNRYGRAVLKESVLNLMIGFIGMAITSALLGYAVVWVLSFLYGFHFYQIENNVFSLLLCLVLMDFLYYCVHYYAHNTNIGWAAHIVHHSTKHFNLSVGMRIGWTQHYFALIFVPLPLIGFKPELIVMCYAIQGAYQFISHLSYRVSLPIWFERIFITPGLHSLHHATNKEYLGTNLGSIFSIWDQIFGTYTTPQSNITIRYYDVTTEQNILKANFKYYIAIGKRIKMANSWKSRLGYIFCKPGWQPRS